MIIRIGTLIRDDQGLPEKTNYPSSSPLRAPLLSLCLFVATMLMSPLLHAQTILTDLGDLGGGSSQGESINDSGEVVGYSISNASTGATSAFLYSDGTMTNLQPALDTGFAVNSSAFGINDSGQVVGENTTSDGASEYAFLYDNGTVTNLGTLGGTVSSANSINSSGQIVGTSYTTGNAGEEAFLYENGTMTGLGTLTGYTSSSSAVGINNSGQIAVNASNSTGRMNAFIDTNGTKTNLGTLGGTGTQAVTEASAINNSGQVVGVSYTSSGIESAFLYSNGTMTNLNTLGAMASWAYGINNSGEVVGSLTLNDSGPGPDAFLYTSATGMENLNTIYASLLVSNHGGEAGFYDLSIATGVNDEGQITGVGDYWNGSTDEGEAFVLSPQATPEPSTWMLLLGGLAVLGWARLRVRTKRD